MKRVFLDTNILIDLLNEKREKNYLAKKLIEKLINEDYEIFISEDMLSTVYYVVKNQKKVLNFYKDIVYDKYWHIVPFEKEVIEEAIEFSLKNDNDFEDLLQCFTAKKYNAILITEDKKFVDCGIKVLGYEEFLRDDYEF